MSTEIFLTYIAYPEKAKTETFGTDVGVGLPAPTSVSFALARIYGETECRAFSPSGQESPRISPHDAYDRLTEVLDTAVSKYGELDGQLLAEIILLEKLRFAYPSGEIVVEEVAPVSEEDGGAVDAFLVE